MSGESSNASTAAVFSGGLNLASGISQYSASNMQGRYAQAAAEDNARLIDRQAADVVRRGFNEASLYKKKIKQTQASQKVSLAAQGIEISGDTALQILQETAEIGEVDAMTIRNNAYRQAYGLKAQAIDLRAQGKFSRAEASARGMSSLVTSGLKAFDSFYSATSSPKETKKYDARNMSSNDYGSYSKKSRTA